LGFDRRQAAYLMIGPKAILIGFRPAASRLLDDNDESDPTQVLSGGKPVFGMPSQML